MEDLDEYTTLLEFTPENQVISYIQQDLIQNLAFVQRQDYTKIAKLRCNGRRKCRTFAKMSPQNTFKSRGNIFFYNGIFLL